MTMRGRAQPRKWIAALIMAVFAVAVAGAAAIGWRYARESPPHLGPIVLISVDGVPASDLTPYGSPRTDTPAIDALARESIVFARAYTHSPQLLPAHASLLTGRLPLEHGVRDDAGFAVPPEASTLAELLRNRGFATGAAVSSFLLQQRSGLAQGFVFFDDEIPSGPVEQPPAVERPGAQTVDAAERWISMQQDQRFFLFVQVAGRDADSTVMRLSAALRQRRLYDGATFVFVGDRGDAGSGLSLDDKALHVPLIVKQPDGHGGARRVEAPVQGIDLLPTILDLVRAPVPGGLHGRSLRPVLDSDGARLRPLPVYAEALTAFFRFGGEPLYALTGEHFRYIRGANEEIVPVTAAGDEPTGESSESASLRSDLDELLSESAIAPPAVIPPSDEDRYALLGYLGADVAPEPADLPLDIGAQRSLVDAHRAAAVLIGQKRYSAGIRGLQAIVRAHPGLAAVRQQLGAVLARTGRLTEAAGELERVRELRPDSSAAARALADVLLRLGRTDGAREQSDAAVALAAAEGPLAEYAAHEMAARVSLASKDPDGARAHAEAAAAADPGMPVPQFVQGRLLYEDGQYEAAAAMLADAIGALESRGASLADLHFYLGEALARLDRYDEAEAQFRAELRDYPRNFQAYTSLAMLYRAARQDEAVEDVLNELVAATPTPEGYGVAARLWTILGDRSRAEALRSDAQTRFRGDPSLALLGRGTR